MSEKLTENQQEKRSEIDELLADVADKYPVPSENKSEYSLPLNSDDTASDLESAAKEQDESSKFYSTYELKLAEQIEQLKFEHKTIGGLDPQDVSEKLKKMFKEIQALSRQMYDQVVGYKDSQLEEYKAELESQTNGKSEHSAEAISTDQAKESTESEDSAADYHSLLREARLEAKNILAEAERLADEEMLKARARLRQELDQTEAEIENRKQRISELTTERDSLIEINHKLQELYQSYHQDVDKLLEQVNSN